MALSGNRRLGKTSHKPWRPRLATVERLEDRRMLTVTYRGGALLTSVEVQGVYYGSDWKTNAALTSQSAGLDKYLGYIVNSSYMDMLTQAGYGVGRGTASAGVINAKSVNKNTALSDSTIRSDIQSMITKNSVATPDANRLYVVFVEPGVNIKLGTSTSSRNFLGYHGAFAGKTAAGKAADIHYAVIAYPGTPNYSAASQGFYSNSDWLTGVSSHEIAEAVTDPNVNYKALGWYDSALGEIGDIVNGQEVTLNSYAVQKEANQQDQAMIPLGATAYTSGSTTAFSTVTGAAGIIVVNTDGAGGTVDLNPSGGDGRGSDDCPHGNSAGQSDGDSGAPKSPTCTPRGSQADGQISTDVLDKLFAKL